MTQNTSSAVAAVKTCIDNAADGLVERRHLLELLFMGLITDEHLLLIGPPGTAKSMAVKRAAAAIDARYFEYLIGRFSEPNELFGSLDLAALQRGVVEPVTTNMLPEAQIAFLDEIFLGSTAILNTLLSILNERTYKRGPVQRSVPLRSCVSASNALPDDPMLAAFADRFLYTIFLEPVREENMSALLEGGWNAEVAGAAQDRHDTNDGGAPQPKALASVSLQDIDTLRAATLRVDLTQLRDTYAHFIRKLRVIGITLSDRRIVKAQKALAAAAVLRGVQVAEVKDLWPIVYLVQDKDKQAQVSDLLHEELSQAENPVFGESVKRAAYGPAAHARYLTTRGQSLLESKPQLRSDQSYEIWLVRLETLKTAIDAAFSEESLPQDLKIIRTALLSHLDAGSSQAGEGNANRVDQSQDNDGENSSAAADSDGDASAAAAPRPNSISVPPVPGKR